MHLMHSSVYSKEIYSREKSQFWRNNWKFEYLKKNGQNFNKKGTSKDADYTSLSCLPSMLHVILIIFLTAVDVFFTCIAYTGFCI